MLLLLSPGGKHVDAHVGGPSVRCQEDAHERQTVMYTNKENEKEGQPGQS